VFSKSFNESCSNKALVFVQGPYLVRSAQIMGSTVALTGDIINSTAIEVFAPNVVKSVSWNGRQLRVLKTSYGSLQATLPKPDSIRLPDLNSWKFNDSLPERFPEYSDSGIAWVGTYTSFIYFELVNLFITIKYTNTNARRCESYVNSKPNSSRIATSPLRR
jgi:hypothetical protein